ncbi:hypothetical protein BBJ28_00017180 [Nothophytophthora sp. Chile5]|nr:hypothetical protein BBJ28_00017180 [Nothophytophthora sp. Chile5]
MLTHQNVLLAQTAEPIHSCESSDAERLGVQTATTETPQEPSKLSRRALVQLTLSVEDAGDRSTHTTTGQHRPAEQEAEPMAEAKDAKKKRRMFSAPLLRRSATASSAAAASAASRIKSNFSTDKLAMLPTSLKRSTTSSGSATASTSARAADAAGTRKDKANGDRAPTIPALKRASTDSKPREPKAAPSHPHTRKFGIPSLMRVRTSSKEKEHVKPPPSPAFSASNCPLDSPEPQSIPNTTAGSAPNSKALPPLPPHKPSSSTASRFVSRMPSMLKRVVSSSHAANTASTQSVPHTTPDTSASSTPRGDFPEDNELEENERRSLLLMLQVPETQRRSQLPLMAASQTW